MTVVYGRNIPDKNYLAILMKTLMLNTTDPCNRMLLLCTSSMRSSSRGGVLTRGRDEDTLRHSDVTSVSCLNLSLPMIITRLYYYLLHVLPIANKLLIKWTGSNLIGLNTTCIGQDTCWVALLSVHELSPCIPYLQQ